MNRAKLIIIFKLKKIQKNVLTIKEQNGIIDEYRARDENI